MNAEARDRVRGILFGLAAGDRIGGPVRMALELAESLIGCAAFDVRDIAGRYLSWWRMGGFDTGPTAARVFESAATGLTYEKAAIQVHRECGEQTAGCNPAHRCAPIAMAASIPDELVGMAAQEEAMLTHRHPLAGDVAAAVAALCRALIRGLPWAEAIALASGGRLPETQQALAVSAEEGLSRGGHAPEVLRAAVFFLHHSYSFSAALERAVDFAGPSNYCPVLVGCIGGAKWGRSAIPDSVLPAHAGLLERISNAAEVLEAGW
ncbi:MAG: ADP-ribosylglycohydrolase [Syntrophaceae bacterium PtaU1.Bin231]|nr:MAG: ADP-ribosylglycohydrolase [Syntrophaceae bacterium PtaU1.Bin231]